MELLCTTPVKIINISDDDDVLVIHSTRKTPKRKRKRAKIIDPVEEYSESVRSNRSSSSRTKKVLIDISDDEIEILSKTSNSFMCEICVDEKPVSENFQIMGCNHSYCNQCTVNYIASKLQQNIPRISCPVSGCKGNYEPYYCRSILPKEVFDRWGDALCEMMIMDSEKFYCPYKNCSALLINERVILVNRQSRCPECKRFFCANCKVPWHKGIVCEEFQKLQKNNEAGTEDMLLMKLAKRRRWQRCPKCRIYVARTKGCPHMQCRCGCHFCYKCGAELNANHNCTN